MNILDKIKTLLDTATAEMTADELRQVLVDIKDETETAENSITALVTRNGELETQVSEQSAEIDRLKESNGRLYKERMGFLEDIKKEEEKAETNEEKIKKLEEEIDY